MVPGGATLVGWGVMAALVVRHAFSRREAWAWRAMTAGLVSWYVLDTLISAWSHVWANVLLNTLLAILFAIPLVATSRVRVSPSSDPNESARGRPHPRTKR